MALSTINQPYYHILVGILHDVITILIFQCFSTASTTIGTETTTGKLFLDENQIEHCTVHNHPYLS